MSATRSARAPGVAARAPVLEVFASIQGEGQFVGEPQVFVRLAGCPLRCRWCDTPGSWSLAAEPRARIAAHEPRREPGWATPFQVATWMAAVEPGHARTVSVTGGEPLLWPDFVRELGAFVGRRRVHLETAGAHPEALAQVLSCVDHVSLDLKLPADMEPPVPVGAGSAESVPTSAVEWSAVRARVLELVRGRDACAKLLLSGERRAQDFRAILDDVAAIAPELPLFVQPVTPVNGVPAPSAEQIGELVEACLERNLAVRVVPQVHRQLGIP